MDVVVAVMRGFVKFQWILATYTAFGIRDNSAKTD